MLTEVTVSLSETVYHQASRLAELMNRDVPGVLAETIENALSPLGPTCGGLTPVEELSDSEVLATAELRMDETRGKRLGKLLERQQAGKLRDEERTELNALMQVCHESLLRKAQALREAVRRGLRGPLDE